jgi:hypothetical protein
MGIDCIEIIADDNNNGPELPPSMMPAATLKMEEAGSYSKKRPSEKEIGNDDNSGPELPPSMMPAAMLKMEKAGSHSKKMASASNSKVETIDDDEHAIIGENVDSINLIGVDDNKLVAKLKSEESKCNSKRRSTESSTLDETINNGDDSTRAYVCGITNFPSGRTAHADNWDQYPENPAHISTAAIHHNIPTLLGATRVPGIFPKNKAGVDVESSGATAGINVPLAVPVNVMMWVEYDDHNLTLASRLEP